MQHRFRTISRNQQPSSEWKSAAAKCWKPSAKRGIPEDPPCLRLPGIVAQPGALRDQFKVSCAGTAFITTGPLIDISLFFGTKAFSA
jgi:hypothetical protein